MKKKRILISGIILILVVLGIIINYSAKESKEGKITLITGKYYDEELTGEIIIYEDGTARYVPEFKSVESYYGVYTYENHLLTINDKSIFCEFKFDGDSLALQRYKDVSGKINECTDSKIVYEYSDGEEPNVLRIAGGRYVSGKSSLSINSYGNKATYIYDEGNSTFVTGEYVFEDDKLIVDNAIEFIMKDGKLILLKENIGDNYTEYENGEKVFEFVYYD